MTALVTGASRGIGRATAALLAEQGYRVAIGYRCRQDAAQSLAAELAARGHCAQAFAADVTVAAQVEALFAAVEAALGPVELLINNAGIAQQKLFTDLTEEEWDAMLAANLKSVFLCCRAAVPGMVRRKRGKIINLSSMWGQVGASCEVHYSAAKAGVIGLTKALAKELGPSGIQVNCVAPGVIDTEMNGALTPQDLAALREETPLGRLGSPAEVAAVIGFLASPAGDFLTGQVLSPNGGMVI